MTVAETQRCSVTRGAHVVLRDITFSVARGQRIVVTGRGGAGLSTLLKTLAGLIPEIEPATVTGSLTRAQIIGYVSQDPDGVLIEPRVADDVAYGTGKTPDDALIGGCLSAVGLAGFAQRSTGELSGGEVQRVAIAGAIAREATLHILDDATSDLDPAGRIAILSTLAGRTVLLSSHDPAVIGWADRVIGIREGELLVDCTPDELFADSALCDALGVRTPEERARPPRSASVGSGAPVARATGVTYRFPNGNVGIESADLCVNRGEVVALRGANGAGKSTLARCMAGLVAPSEGEVHTSPHTTMVLQNPDRQTFSETAIQEVAFAALERGMPRREALRCAAVALERVGLGDLRQRHPWSLSRSARQLLAVAGAIATKPDFVIFDEPTAGLDAQSWRCMADIIAELAEGGAGVLVITHDDAFAEVATRCVDLTPVDHPPHAQDESSSSIWDPRWAGSVFVAACIALMIVTAPAHLGIIAGLGLLISVVSAEARKRVGRAVVAIAPLALLIGVFGYLLPPTRVADAALYAVTLVLRLLGMIIWTSWLIATVDGERAITLLRASRLPQALVLVITMALRFIPTLHRRMLEIRQAQRARGARLDSGGPLRKARQYVIVLIPLFVSSIRSARDLAGALMLRAPQTGD